MPSDQDYGEQLGDVVERILDAVVENVGGAAGSLQSQRLQPPPVRQPNHRATTSLISNRRAASPQGGRHNPADVRSALGVPPAGTAYPIASPRSHGASASTPHSSPSPNHGSEQFQAASNVPICHCVPRRNNHCICSR